MLRICVLTTSFPRFSDDEAGIFVSRLVEGYSQCGASGLVIVPFDHQESESSTCASFVVRRFRYGLFSRGALAFGAGIVPNLRRNPLLIFQAPILFFQLAYQAWKLRDSFEVIHANWTPAIIAAAIVNVLSGKPFFVTARGEDMNLLKNRALRCAVGWALRRAQFIASVNEGFVADLKQAYAGKLPPCYVIPNGVEVREVQAAELAEFEKLQVLPQLKRLLFVGTLIPRKRVEILLELLSKPEFASFCLVLCGRVEDETYAAGLKELSVQLGIAERVVFKGPVAPSLVPLYLKACDAFVSASAFEGRPNALLEALAAGMFVAVSDIPAHREIIQDGRNGFLFQIDSTALEAQRIKQALDDSEASRNLRRGAKAGSIGQTWKHCAGQYLSALSQVGLATK